MTSIALRDKTEPLVQTDLIGRITLIYTTPQIQHRVCRKCDIGMEHDDFGYFCMNCGKAVNFA